MRALALIAGLVAMVSNAGTIDDTIPDSRYREYGTTFAAFTKRLDGRGPDGKVAVGTCTLISPHWALTAAHVVVAMQSAVIESGDSKHHVTLMMRHGEYRGHHGEHDIALVRVSDPFRLKTYPPLTDGSERLGSVCAAVGYGLTGTLTSGYRESDSRIRAGTMRLDATEMHVWVCQIRHGGSPLPFCIAPGDSGGGLWAQSADGRTVLVGVNSYTAKPGKTPVRSRAGEQSGHTRVALYLDWIRETIWKFDGKCSLAECQPPDRSP